jgi:hypothetical protein
MPGLGAGQVEAGRAAFDVELAAAYRLLEALAAARRGPELAAGGGLSVLAVEGEHPDGVDDLPGAERVDAGGEGDGHLPQQRGLAAAFGRGEDQPVLPFEEAGHHPVVDVLVLDEVEDVLDGQVFGGHAAVAELAGFGHELLDEVGLVSPVVL